MKYLYNHGVLAVTLFASAGCNEFEPKIVVIDEIDPPKVDRCIKRHEHNAIIECLIGKVPNWHLEIEEWRLVDGWSDPNPPIADSVVALLQNVVDKCNLGQTYLQSGSDSGGRLLIGDPDLTSAQIECVQAAERPGLRLGKREL